jgi:serine protease inhibitor
MRTRLPILLLPLLITGCAALGVPMPLPLASRSPSLPSPESSGPVTAGIELARANTPRLSTDADPKPAAAAMNAFGVDLYAHLAKADGNLVFSPASIELALAMLRPGARGTTASQMDTAMHEVGSDAMAPAISALGEALDTRSGTYPDNLGEDVPVTLRIANSAFAQHGLRIEPAYLNALSSRFGAGVRLVDYATDFEAARKRINDWVADQTEQRIRDLLAPGSVDDLTRLVLANAIYLKAPWLVQFSKEATSTQPFTTADGRTVRVPMMSQQESFGYATGKGWQAVDLPYVGGSLSMTLILPDDLTAFEDSLSGDSLHSIIGALSSRDVQLSLPRFDIETKADLPEQLSAMGMPLAFDAEHADFSGITTDDRLYVTDVVHQANITVDEAGTVAAGATAVVVGRTSMPSDIARMNVDRPFLFAVRDDPTGTILFLGRVTDPSATR